MADPKFPIDWDAVMPYNPPANISASFLYGADGLARNYDSFSVEFAQLSLMAQNRFKWTSKQIAPYERLSEYIEFLLFWYGQCCVVHEGGIWKVKQCIANGNMGAYRMPEQFTTRDWGGGNTKVYNRKDVIWIKNNAACIPTFWLLRHRCDRIAHIERVMDLNIDAQKTPYIIEAQPEVKLSLVNVFKQIRDMFEVVFTNASKGGIRDKIKVLDLNAPYLVDKLYAQKQNEYNDALNLLGIDTIDEKRERLISQETEVSNELTENYIDIFYATRKIALEEMQQRIGDVELKVMKAGSAEKEKSEIIDDSDVEIGGGEQ